MGPDTVLSKNEEKFLEDWIINLAKCGFPLKPSDLLNTVQKIILEEKNRHNILNCPPELQSDCQKDEQSLRRKYLENGADGQILPPLGVFPYVRSPPALVKSMPDKWVLRRSETGWMRSESFFENVANSFVDYLSENNIKRVVLFLVDGHKYHLTMELSDFCRSSRIILYALYSNKTHITQPADVGAFKGLKSDYKKTVHKWQSIPANENKAVTKTNFCELLKAVLNSTDTTESIKNAFRKCGIFPFNLDAIDFAECLALAKTYFEAQGIDFASVMRIIDKVQNEQQPNQPIASIEDGTAEFQELLDEANMKVEIP
ncbi:uncharacterized protein LOC129950377 [Eupeodes corollae]|uniref:uncharacterized protein LOC129950377 n=1 Tax=Eupeodes corollae TaxID=290404 RepID=UPI0024903AC9|nr:uncharacterized protein LOC129950377 [Eupeodes corollae]